jgi:hypothetical protein
MNRNISILAELLELDEAIRMDSSMMLHPWAENPRSICALTACHIGILAYDKAVMASETFIQDVIKNDVVKKLVKMLESKNRDQFEAAAVALMFLSESKKYVDIILSQGMIKAKAIPALVKLMKDLKEELRTTAATCCRNMYLNREPAQIEFLKEGGGSELIKLLTSIDSITVSETAMNILDLILDQNDKIQEEIKQILLSLNIQSFIKQILLVIYKQNEDIYERSTIEEVQKLHDIFELA